MLRSKCRLDKRSWTKEVRSATSYADCGESPFCVRCTVISQNTRNKDSSVAKKSFDTRFGVANYEAVSLLPLEGVSALRCGGLVNIKGRRIKMMLNQAYEKYGG